MKTDQDRNTTLPTGRTLTLSYALSFIIAVLMAAASVTGLIYRAIAYPTDDLLQSFVSTDVVNLLIGLPILLGSMWLTRRGMLIGLLLWPGALCTVQLSGLCLCDPSQCGAPAAPHAAHIELVHPHRPARKH